MNDINSINSRIAIMGLVVLVGLKDVILSYVDFVCCKRKSKKRRKIGRLF